VTMQPPVCEVRYLAGGRFAPKNQNLRPARSCSPSQEDCERDPSRAEFASRRDPSRPAYTFFTCFVMGF